MAGVVTPAVTVRVVPASQSQEQTLQVRMAGKLVHERPELLVRGVHSCGWRHRCTSVDEQEDLLSSLCDVPGPPKYRRAGPTTLGPAGRKTELLGVSMLPKPGQRLSAAPTAP